MRAVSNHLLELQTLELNIASNHLNGSRASGSLRLVQIKNPANTWLVGDAAQGEERERLAYASTAHPRVRDDIAAVA